MTKQALIIFVRRPEKGKVKTRLAATIGDDAALFIYRKLLAHTVSVVKKLTVDTYVFYAGEIGKVDEWRTVRCFKRKQADADLGGRMKAAFEQVFREGYHQAVLIGSDCPQLTSGHVQRAFQALANDDVVIGPASDGGYYLLGLKNVYSKLFENIPWSTSIVYQKTVEAMKAEQLRFFLLDVLTDVDEEKDLPAAWKLDIK